jgi:hypothetical protein
MVEEPHIKIYVLELDTLTAENPEDGRRQAVKVLLEAMFRLGPEEVAAAYARAQERIGWKD